MRVMVNGESYPINEELAVSNANLRIASFHAQMAADWLKESLARLRVTVGELNQLIKRIKED